MNLKINQVAFDSENKEFVLISNGIEIGQSFIPTEAIAMRIVGWNEFAQPIIGFTYRKVNCEKLSSCKHTKETFFGDTMENQHPIHYKNIGRV